MAHIFPLMDVNWRRRGGCRVLSRAFSGLWLSVISGAEGVELSSFNVVVFAFLF
jgi:hypothetical protein